MKTEAEIAQALSAGDAEERRRAVEVLARTHSDRRVEFLITALGDSEWRVRKQAVEVVRELAPAPELLARLISVLEPGDNVGLRNAAVECLGAFGADAVDAIEDALPLLDADGRKLAAEALGRSRQERAIAVLRGLSTDPDPNVRAAAVEAVAAAGSSDMGGAAAILSQVLLTEDRFLRLIALDGINRMGVLLPWPTIERLMSDPVLERAAVAAAGRSAHPEALFSLLSALGHASESDVQALLAALVDCVRASAQNQLMLRAPVLEPVLRSRLCELCLRANADLPSRKAALVVAGALGLEEIAPIAAEALSEPSVFAEADEALEFLGPVAVSALLSRARQAEPEAAAVCLDLVPFMADAELAQSAVEEISALLAAAAPEVVRAGMGALSRIGDESCLVTVAQWLDVDYARSAAETAFFTLAERCPEAARALASGARADGPRAHAAALIHAALPPPVRTSIGEDVAFLSSLMSSDSPALRRAALSGLAATESALGVETAAFALTDEEAEVRVAAVEALGRLRTPDGSLPGIRSLLDLVETSSDQELVGTALRALGETGDQRALSVLRSRARHEVPQVAVSAIEALAVFPDFRRVDALIEGLSHADAEVVKASLLALTDVMDPRVLAHFGACLDHDAWDVRRLAADTLGQVPFEAAAVLLRARLAIEDNAQVKAAIARALEDSAGTRRTPLPPRTGSLHPR